MELLRTVESFIKDDELKTAFLIQKEQLEKHLKNINNNDEASLAESLYSVACHFIEEQLKQDFSHLGIPMLIELERHSGIESLNDLSSENMPMLFNLNTLEGEPILVNPLERINGDPYGLLQTLNTVVEPFFQDSEFLLTIPHKFEENGVDTLSLVQNNTNLIKETFNQQFKEYIKFQCSLTKGATMVNQEQKAEILTELELCEFVPKFNNRGDLNGVYVIHNNSDNDEQIIRQFSRDYDLWLYFADEGLKYDLEEKPNIATFHKKSVNFDAIPYSTMKNAPLYNSNMEIIDTAIKSVKPVIGRAFC